MIPVIAIRVSLVGTVAILLALGITLNNLSLFGLVLAVGIVATAAVTGESNCRRCDHCGRKRERNMRAGMSAF